MSKVRAFLKNKALSTAVVWNPKQYPFSNHTYFLQVHPEKRVFDTSDDWKQTWVKQYPGVRFVEYDEKNQPKLSYHPKKNTDTKDAYGYEELK